VGCPVVALPMAATSHAVALPPAVHRALKASLEQSLPGVLRAEAGRTLALLEDDFVLYEPPPELRVPDGSGSIWAVVDIQTLFQKYGLPPCSMERLTESWNTAFTEPGLVRDQPWRQAVSIQCLHHGWSPLPCVCLSPSLEQATEKRAIELLMQKAGKVSTTTDRLQVLTGKLANHPRGFCPLGGLEAVLQELFPLELFHPLDPAAKRDLVEEFKRRCVFKHLRPDYGLFCSRGVRALTPRAAACRPPLKKH
jgi:hypothetical protein